MDPRIIIRAIEDLRLKIEFLSDKRRSTMKDCAAHQRLGEEYVDRASRETALRLSEAEVSLLSAQNSLSIAENGVEKSHRLVEKVQQQQVQANRVYQYVRERLAFWQSQLGKANEWERRAQSRVHLANTHVEAAKYYLNEAEQEVSMATMALEEAKGQTELQQTGTDRNGNPITKEIPVDTTPYLQALINAKAKHEHAIARLAEANIELQNAKQDLRKAQSQVQGATRAVNDCQSAVAPSDRALTIANRAYSNAEKSLDEVRHAERALQRAVTEYENEVNICSVAAADATTARRSLEEGRLQLMIAENATLENYQTSRLADQSLEERSSWLWAFDTPNLRL